MDVKSVLVTGAAGYMGHHVVKAFLDAGYQVLVNDLNYKGVDERAVRQIFSLVRKIFTSKWGSQICWCILPGGMGLSIIQTPI